MNLYRRDGGDEASGERDGNPSCFQQEEKLHKHLLAQWTSRSCHQRRRSSSPQRKSAQSTAMDEWSYD